MRGAELATAAIGMLLSICPAHPQSGSQGNWQTIEADNGAIYKVDMNSISHNRNGTADMLVYFDEGSRYIPTNLRRLWFDCQGRYRDLSPPGIGPTQYAPPRSIAGRLSEIACAGAKDKLAEQFSRPPENVTPQYCEGFPPEACARIMAAAKAKKKPIYCEPGFQRAESRLSIEQIRTCSVVLSGKNRLVNPSKTQSAGKDPKNAPYDFKLAATRSRFPNITGSTSLPDGAKLIISINKPRLPNAKELLAAGLPMCEENCLPASGPKNEMLGVTTTVLAGAFSAGPFSWAGKPFRHGAVEVEVYLFSLPGEADRGDDLRKQMDRMRKPILTTSVNVDPE